MTTYSLRGLFGGTYFELPDFQSASASFEFSDTGALDFDYPITGVNASQLVDYAQVLLLKDGTEVDNGRFLLGGMSSNEEANNQAVVKCQGKSLHMVLDNAKVLGPTPATPTPMTFVSKTPGEIIRTLFAQAQARGTMTGITYGTFSDTLDANSVAWGSTISITYDVGTSYLEILRDMVAKGVVEFKFVGTDFRMYKGDAMGIDKTALSTPVTLRTGVDFVEAPFQRTTDQFASDVYVQGDTTYVKVADVSVTHPFGRQEVLVSQSGTDDSGTLTLVGNVELAKRHRTTVQKTRKMIINAETKFFPLQDFNTSDYIFQVSNGLAEKIRIRMMTVELGSDGITACSLVLNDKILEQEILDARRLDGITNGAVSTVGGTPTDTTTPNAPVAPSVSSTTYTMQDGSPGAVVSVTITPPTTNTDGSVAADLSTYYVRWRYADANVPPNPGAWQNVNGTASNVVAFSAVRPGVAIEVQAAVSDTSSHISAWSTSNTHTTTTDSTPPPVPINITAISYLGSLKIIWDGTFTGPVLWTNRPTDFRHCEVHVSTSSGFTPDDTTRVANLFGPGNVSVPALTYGVTYYVKLKSVDSYGNKSAASTAVSAVPQLAQAGDIEPSVLADLTSDPVFVQYFGNGDGVSGWTKYSGAGTLSWYLDTLSPTVPGVLRSTGSVLCEWQASLPMPYDPEAVYNFRGRFKITAPEVALDGSFALGTNAQWDTTWSGTVTANYTGNTGKITSTGSAQNAILRNKGTNSNVVNPGDIVRVSGKVRTSGASSSDPYVEILTNTASSGTAVYLQTGVVAQQSDHIGPSTTYVNFTFDFTIPAGDDRYNIYLRDQLDNTEWVEWDDISIKVFSADVKIGMIGYKADRTTPINPDNVATDKTVIHAPLNRLVVTGDEWLEYDVYISDRSDGASAGDGATANTAVSMAEQTRYWRPAFIFSATSASEIFDIDWFQIDRIKANIAIPGAVIASQVAATSISTDNLVVNDTLVFGNTPQEDYVLTSLDGSGAAAWARPKSTVSIGAVQPGGQLLSPEDSKFEDGTTGTWVVGTNCTIQNNVADTGPDGAPTRSLRFTASAAGNMSTKTATNQQYKAKEGDIITASASMKTSIADSVQLDIVFLSSSNSVLRTDSGTPLALGAGVWGTPVNTVSSPAPSGTAAVQIIAYVLSASTSQTGNITNVRLISDQVDEPEDPRPGDQWFDQGNDFSEFIVVVRSTDTTARSAANNSSTWTALNSTFETFNIDIPCDGVLEIDFAVWLKVGTTAGTIEFNVQVKTATGCSWESLEDGTFFLNRASVNNAASAMTSDMICRGSDVLKISGVDPAVGAQLEMRWHFRSNSTSHTYRLPSAICRFRPFFNDYAIKVVQTT